MQTPDAVSDAAFELLERHNEAIIELLPEKSPLRNRLQTDVASLRLVRRYVAQLPPDKAKTDWPKLLTLFFPAILLIVTIIAEFLGIDWRGMMP